MTGVHTSTTSTSSRSTTRRQTGPRPVAPTHHPHDGGGRQVEGPVDGAPAAPMNAGDSHAEIATAALAAGRHMLCEKPPANSIDEAERMVQAARSAAAGGVRSMVAYRRVPAAAFARRLVDPVFPLVWRLQRDRAGSGALGDLARSTSPVTGSSGSARSPRPSSSGDLDRVVRHRRLFDRRGHGRRRRAVSRPARGGLV